MIKIKKGLDLPINGKPEQKLSSHAPTISTVAVLGPDYNGCKPTMAVKEGDTVKLGQLLFSDKKIAGAKFTAPAAGKVVAVNRGEKRALQSVVIEIAGDDAEQFSTYDANAINSLDKDTIKQYLSDSGVWTALRTRPFSKTPALDTEASSIFVTAIDTNPLAANPALFINEHKESFELGLLMLSKLAPKLFVCTDSEVSVSSVASNVEVKQFGGKHPAGNVGTHIHMLDPVARTKFVWYIGYQDVIALGKLLQTGKLFTERMVSIAGPRVNKPQIVKTQVGVNITELTAGLLTEGNNRVLSGSVWNGRKVIEHLDFLGAFHDQITVLDEGNDREFLGWLKPGSNKFSVIKGFASALTPKKMFNFSATTNGSERAMVPLGQYEALMPLDILPTQLLRALAVGDIVKAMELGCLELDEEDLALCTFACAGKYEYGPILRDNLTRIEKET